MFVGLDRKDFVSKDLVGYFGMFVESYGNFDGSFGMLMEVFDNLEVELGNLIEELDIYFS